MVEFHTKKISLLFARHWHQLGCSSSFLVFHATMPCQPTGVREKRIEGREDASSSVLSLSLSSLPPPPALKSFTRERREGEGRRYCYNGVTQRETAGLQTRELKKNLECEKRFCIIIIVISRLTRISIRTAEKSQRRQRSNFCKVLSSFVLPIRSGTLWKDRPGNNFH